tara:strand:+ start:987 stop:1466 length:480 start_codon:yes stop_codon:yes gene_type:complete
LIGVAKTLLPHHASAGRATAALIVGAHAVDCFQADLAAKLGLDVIRTSGAVSLVGAHGRFATALRGGASRRAATERTSAPIRGRECIRVRNVVVLVQRRISVGAIADYCVLVSLAGGSGRAGARYVLEVATGESFGRCWLLLAESETILFRRDGRSDGN